ncbi:hypothetical protein [Lacrimispora sp.]|uniref:hypothetical protein n=1 Tax=Lacrimispora sp. TaxID=2719234 RepID=UPI0028B25EFC|nr:hypothetical protein [Lacrimispora sp.]
MLVFVCQLPQKWQNEIVSKCRKVFETLGDAIDTEEEIENVLNSKVKDVSAIDASPYLKYYKP